MIKKVLIFFILIFINVNSHAYYDIDKKSGTIISGKLTIDSKTSIELGEGEWIIFNTDSWFVNAIHSKYIAIYQLDPQTNEIMQWIEINELTGLRKWTGYLMPWLESNFWKPDANNDPDGCVKRSHYNLFQYIKNGMFYNCLVVTILDTDRRLYGEDKDPYASKIRKAIRDGEAVVPKIMLKSEQLYLSFADKDKLIKIYTFVSPKYYNYNTKELTRDNSEFHPKNINKHPDAKKIMDRWIKRQKLRHNSLEISMGAKEKRFLFSEHKKKKLKKTSYSSDNKITNNDIVNQLKKLDELYKSGVLTREEYEKVKKKLIN
tara:strand:- start:377 stop:1330 length:954 start_codon:yes stop_codon:yes gene_type:complete